MQSLKRNIVLKMSEANRRKLKVDVDLRRGTAEEEDRLFKFVAELGNAEEDSLRESWEKMFPTPKEGQPDAEPESESDDDHKSKSRPESGSNEEG